MTQDKRYLDPESKFRGAYTREVFQALGFAYKGHRLTLLACIIIGFIARLMILFNGNIVSIWVDSLCTGSNNCKPVPALFQGFTSTNYIQMIAAVTVGGMLLTLAFRLGFSLVSAHAISRFYDEVTLRTSRFPMSFFDTNPVGRIVTRFSSDYGNMFRLFGGPLAELSALVFDISSMILLLVLASPYFALILVPIAIINWAIYSLNKQSMRRERRELSMSRSPSISHFAESAQGASQIRIFNRQSVFFKRFENLNDLYNNQRIRTITYILRFSLEMAANTAFSLLIAGLLGLYLVEHNLISVGAIGAAFTYIVLSGTSVRMLFEWMAQFEEAMTSTERMNEYLRKPTEVRAKLPPTAHFPTGHPQYSADEWKKVQHQNLTTQRSAEIEIRDLWFRYSPQLPYVLKGLNCRIPAGEKWGIIGRTGSGKSSLIQALFHLYPYEKGEIRIAGHSANDVDLSVYRRAIALITQESILFRGTIRSNLDQLKEHRDAELMRVLEQVGLGPWLSEQKLGLESKIEERGRNLSSGEQQLLCMARCLLQEAPIVILDEATSAVDPQSEEIMMRATREFFKGRTQLIVAHRLSTLTDCDQIMWIKNGEIHMIGKPSEVIPVFSDWEHNLAALDVNI